MDKKTTDLLHAMIDRESTPSECMEGLAAIVDLHPMEVEKAYCAYLSDKLNIRVAIDEATILRTYHPTLLEHIYNSALLGLNDIQMAASLSLTYDEFALWREKIPEIDERLTDGRGRANGHAAHALYQMAIGYYYEEEKLYFKEGEALTKMVKRYCKPDKGAAEVWLKAKKRDVWVEGVPLLASPVNPNQEATLEETERVLRAAGLMEVTDPMLLKPLAEDVENEPSNAIDA